MSRASPACPRCGAVPASDQEYCIECGERTLTEEGSPWTAPLAAIAVVLAVAGVVLALAYGGLNRDADRQAAAPSPTSTTAIKAGRPRPARPPR